MSIDSSPRNILVVCTANRCRSPMAATLLNKIVGEHPASNHWQISSAGTWGEPDLPATTLAQRMMTERGLDLSQHRARIVDADILSKADVVLVMTRSHLEALRAEFPKMSGKIFLLSQLVGQVYDIEDPYGGTYEDYQRCAAELQKLLNDGFTRLTEWVDQVKTN